jgi:hypothetical protein
MSFTRPFVPAVFTVLTILTILTSPAFSFAAAPPAAPGLPADVAPLPPEQDEHLKELMKTAEKFRGLEARRSVPSGALGEEALQQKMVESLREDLPPAELKAVEASLKAFGLIPETMDLATYFPQLLSTQVAGFYDPERDYLAIVRREGGTLGGGAEKEKGLEDMVLVHELTHALQDQHFNLEELSAVDPLADASTARQALVEGDATLTMFSALAGAAMETLPGVDAMLSALLRDPKEMMAEMGDMPGAREMAAAPAWFRDMLLFSYMRGYAFCVSVKRLGGQKLLDHAFTADPPRSSEQILHPEKWHTRRDDPIILRWPDLPAGLPGFQKVAEGEMGEAGIVTLLREVGSATRATAAAAGWGGDRFAVFARGDERVLAWVTEWDSEADARELEAALRSLGRSWSVTRSAQSPRRVLVLRGKLKKAEREALVAAAAAIKAEAPANRNIDLTALGVSTPRAGS